ncbi:MAG: glycosyltransferase family 39 protein, partial [Candidatus Bathyarchaeia archaeon]
MSSREQIASMMRDVLPECPFCGSRVGYEVISVIKGHVQCKSCGATWSSKDFLLSNKVSRLKINELPRGAHSYNVKGHLIKRYEEYPLSFWRSLYEAKRPHISVKLNVLIEFLAVFMLAFIVILPGFTTHDIGWDEPVYVFAGRAYVTALSERNFFGDVWQWNHEHPPLAKYIYGFFSLWLSPILGNPYFGARIATSLMSALTAAIVYMFSKKFFGKIVGLFSMILLVSMPFYYGMSRYVSLDLPATFFICV